MLAGAASIYIDAVSCCVLPLRLRAAVALYVCPDVRIRSGGCLCGVVALDVCDFARH